MKNVEKTNSLNPNQQLLWIVLTKNTFEKQSFSSWFEHGKAGWAIGMEITPLHNLKTMLTSSLCSLLTFFCAHETIHCNAHICVIALHALLWRKTSQHAELKNVHDGVMSCVNNKWKHISVLRCTALVQRDFFLWWCF